MQFLEKLFGKTQVKKASLGIYGPPNAGKTTLANRVALDLVGREVGPTSPIPHETRTIQKETVELNINGRILELDLLDMPGISTKVDYREFVEQGLPQDEALLRAQEATKGVIEAIKYLDNVDLAITVIDSTKVPYDQINAVIVGNLEARGIPSIIVANKIDLPDARPELVKETFSNHTVIALSALKGDIKILYDTIEKMIK